MQRCVPLQISPNPSPDVAGCLGTWLQDGAKPKETYEIIGTLSDPEETPPKWLSQVIAEDDLSTLRSAILSCR
jgi:hypothetical protein